MSFNTYNQMSKKSPQQQPSEMNVGDIKTGKDTNNWIILENNNIKKWHSLGKYKKYYTIDNGGKPYKVIINDSNVFIFSGLSNIYIVKNYKKIFIGKNTKKYVNYYDKIFTGSAILVETKKNEYVFIGNNIKKFYTTEPVLEFHSIMGNSCVVYPFALTSNYAYLMLYDIYLERNFDNVSPYDEYYKLDKCDKPKEFLYSSNIIDVPK
jgi:hypothetical protein